MQVLFFIFSKFFSFPGQGEQPRNIPGLLSAGDAGTCAGYGTCLSSRSRSCCRSRSRNYSRNHSCCRATAAATPAVIPTAAVRTTAAAEDDDQDQNDPQAAVTTPTVVTTHRQLPPVRDGDRLAISVHLMPQVPGCAPRLGAFFIFSLGIFRRFPAPNGKRRLTT